MPVPGASYLFGNPGNLAKITNFLKSADPDIVGLIEVDIGSMRSGRINQAEAIADTLGHFSAYECKYGEESVNQLIPILRKQGNAFLAAPRITGERFHYFDQGIKRLIIELELDNEGDLVQPYNRIDLYRIGIPVDLRSDRGRLEYWKLTCWAEYRKFLNGAIDS